jgi:hypothetical protein
VNKHKVAVLGCGPAGLLAAWAVEQRGIKPSIISRRIKSRVGGAMYLHRPIEGLTKSKPDGYVKFDMRGDERTYSRKVYGTAHFYNEVSFNKYKDVDEEPAWNIVPVYNTLWDYYGPFIHEIDRITPDDIDWLAKEFDLVICTIPRNAVCMWPAHTFIDQPIYIANANLFDVPPNTFIYNGTEEGEWYRQSNVWGNHATEWSPARLGKAKPPLPDIKTVSKPFKTSCDCHFDLGNVYFAGRFGCWDKNILTHDAFYQSQFAVGKMLGEL